VKSRTSLSSAVAKAASHLENLPGTVIVEKHQALEGVTRAGDKLHGWSSEAEANRFSVVNLGLYQYPSERTPEKPKLFPRRSLLETSRDSRRSFSSRSAIAISCNH